MPNLEKLCTEAQQKIEADDNSGAIEILNKVIREEPAHILAHTLRGAAYFNLGQSDKSLADLNEAMVLERDKSLNSNSAEFYAERGRSNAQLGDYESAIKDFNKPIKPDPNNANYYANRALSNAKLENHEKAIKDYDKAIELEPTSAQLYSNRGSSKHHLKDYVNAIKDYDKAIELNPNDAVYYYNRGNSYARLGLHKDAIKDYDKAIQLNPYSPDTYGKRGNSYATLGLHKDAIKDFNKAIELKSDEDFYYMRGLSKVARGNRANAIEDFNKAIQLKPDSDRSYGSRGAIKQHLGDYQGALNDFDNAIQLNSNEAGYYYNRAIVEEKLGKRVNAIHDLDRAIQLNPNEASYYYQRAISKFGLQKHLDAVKDLDIAIKLSPQADTYALRAGLYYQLNNYLKAIDDINIAIQLNPNFSGHYYTRGAIKQNLGDHENAISDYKTVIQLDPNNNLARENLKSLEQQTVTAPNQEQPLSTDSKRNFATQNAAGLSKLETTSTHTHLIAATPQTETETVTAEVSCTVYQPPFGGKVVTHCGDVTITSANADIADTYRPENCKAIGETIQCRGENSTLRFHQNSLATQQFFQNLGSNLMLGAVIGHGISGLVSWISNKIWPEPTIDKDAKQSYLNQLQIEIKQLHTKIQDTARRIKVVKDKQTRDWLKNNWRDIELTLTDLSEQVEDLLQEKLPLTASLQSELNLQLADIKADQNELNANIETIENEEQNLSHASHESVTQPQISIACFFSATKPSASNLLALQAHSEALKVVCPVPRLST